MKVKYNDVVYNVLDQKDGRVFMEDEDGNKKDIAESTFEKAEVIEEEVVELTPAQKKKQQEDYMNEKVAFKAIYDGEKYKDDITVTVNGKNFQIQRGVRVMVPRYILNVLEDHERQQAEAANTSERYNQQYQENEKQFI
ncbi:MAG: hypothetical protein K9L56_14400 [Clostridiales bacterium]|nr:hypothetical protein [Clostridiales bacterium]